MKNELPYGMNCSCGTLRCDKSHWIGDNPSTIVPMVPLPNNGVPDEPVRWGNSTREADGLGL